MNRFTIVAPAHTGQYRRLLYHGRVDSTVGNGTTSDFWYLEEGRAQHPHNNVYIQGRLQQAYANTNFVGRPVHKWQIFKNYDCNIIFYRYTFYRFLLGLKNYYDSFVVPTNNYPQKVIEFLRKYVPTPLRGLTKMSLEGFYYNHYNFWMQYATKTRDASMLVDEPAVPETLAMSIYKFMLAICDVDFRKIPNTKNIRERVLFKNVAKTMIVAGKGDCDEMECEETGGYDGYDGPVDTDITPLPDINLATSTFTSVDLTSLSVPEKHAVEIFRLSKVLYFGQVKPVDKVSSYTTRFCMTRLFLVE